LLITFNGSSQKGMGKESSEKSGRYGDRAEEVAARTVLKHHKAEGHKKGE
jgi:hypothetical protein